MFSFLRASALPASALLFALAGAGGFGCGENVLVTSWGLSLKASDAGADEIEEADAGYINIPAINAQRARVRAHRDEDRDKAESHPSDSRSSGEKSSH